MRALIFLVMLFPSYAYAGWDFFGHQEVLNTPPADVIKTSETQDDCPNGVCLIPKIVDKVVEVPNILQDWAVVSNKVFTKNFRQKIRQGIKKPFQCVFQRKFFRYR
jgi:hypothetical protein